MYYVYILKLSNGHHYVGYSSDLRRRIREHNKGKEQATKKYLPCKLISYIAFKSKTKALKFEKYLKSGSGFSFKKRRLV